jgi:hypothetical protein
MGEDIVSGLIEASFEVASQRGFAHRRHLIVRC